METLVDIGANLTHDSFDTDRDQVIERACRHGVTRIIVTGASVAGSRAAADLARRYPHTLFATAGVHPHHASSLDAGAVPELASLLTDPAVVAVGECGLDYFRNYSTPPQQEEAFVAQLELAERSVLPVFLHQRDAHDPFLSILKEFRDGLSGAVAHCFTAGREELDAYLDLDLYIGITGWICDERRGRHLDELVRRIPANRLLLETDAPYLMPRDLPPEQRPAGRRNEPYVLGHILRRVAASRREAPHTLATATSSNAERLFRLPPAAAS